MSTVTHSLCFFIPTNQVPVKIKRKVFFLIISALTEHCNGPIDRSTDVTCVIFTYQYSQRWQNLHVKYSKFVQSNHWPSNEFTTK